MAEGRQPLLRGTGQSDVDMGGFNILNVNAVGNVQQATIHVDPLMDDDTIGARGTGLPFKTIAAAVAVAEGGDTIILRPGTHAFDGAIDLFGLPGLTIRGHGAVITSLSEVNETTKFLVRSTGVTFEGIEFNGGVTDTPTPTGDGCLEVTASLFTIRDCYLNYQNGAGIHLSDNFDGVRIFDCDFRLCLYGIFGEVATDITSDTDGVLIKRCNVERNRSVGVALTGPGPDSGFFLTRVQISDCQFTRNDSDGDGVPAISLSFACQGVEVNDNHIKDESKGIVLSQVKGASISGNYMKGMATAGIQLAGCIGVKINDNIHDSRSAAGVPTTTSPILISGAYTQANDAALFIITGNELLYPKVAALSISISNAGAVIINSNRIEGTISLIALVTVTVNDNQFVIPQTTQAILINAGDRASGKFSIIGNRFNFTGASINRCIATVDAAASGIDDVLIEANATPVGQTYGIATYGHSGANAATNVMQIGNVPFSTTGSAVNGWLNFDSGHETAIDSVFVSQSFGSDSTGTRESRFSRFLTINAAITAATNGDTVIVEDGTFNERLNAKNGITVQFNPAARLVCTSAAGCIRSTADNQTFSVYHEHTPIINSQNVVPLVSWDHLASTLHLHADISNTGTGTAARGIIVTDGTVEVWGTVSSANSEGIALPTTGAAPIVHVHGRSLATDISGGLAGVNVQTGIFTATNATIFSTNAGGVTITATTAVAVTLKQCTISAFTGTAVALSITAGSMIPTLRDCVLVSPAGASHSLLASAAQTVRLYGQTLANKGSDPPTNVTFTGGGTYDVNAGVILD